MRLRNLLIIGLSGILAYFVFFSGKKSAVTEPTSDFMFIADTGIYHDVHDKYTDLKARELDARFHRLNKRGVFNGTVLYAENGSILYKGAFGYSDFRKRDTMQVNDAFQLASVSKMFTAYAIMVLKEKGLLDYDDTLTRFIPEFPYPKVTLRQLLTHRSGLSRYMSLADKYWDVNTPIRNEDVIDLFVKYQPAPYFQPDKGFHYCNTNYALLASVVERITGQPFDVFVKEEIFDLLQMDNSFIYHIQDDSVIRYKIPMGISGYRVRGRRIRSVSDYYLNGVMGDKGVYSTVEDLYKFSRGLDTGFPIPLASLEEAFIPGSPKYYKRKDNYGFGWRLKEEADSTAYHFGWWKGFRTYFIRDMYNQRTLIALTNTHSGVSSGVLWDIIQNDEKPDDLLSIYRELE
jgi:CubicO group peptidase (beta-lactamase class C family)